ncbi:MAG: bifunctional pantoate--beta-alanine ligase/(d)CMP kinase [Merismopedia sp. SIO2A8]|nr:bifunctional pantoate--beta-alanine ligase/(d)CMP kinase [Symploca sp. SIO2B6]NET48000.1 bifunctional pantoate--beta-alanine ligase/(d)CMP kinase [Merismopedia sp. SIO2A8]
MYLFTTVAGLSRYLSLSRSQQHPFHPPLAGAEGNTGQQQHDANTENTALTDPSSREAHFNIGLVPTMGALHDGHLSLIHRARQENTLVVVSIFVNPLQFGPSEDLHEYPRTLERDRHRCEMAGVDVIFAPSIRELYRTSGTVPDAEDVTQVIPPVSMTSVLCGRSRLGHFEGVATVVTRLLNLVQPERAYFGQKDAQQVAILKRLIQDLNLPVEVVRCPIIREASGLALSSRNQYLTDEQKEQATVLYRSLKQAATLFQEGEQDSAVLMDAVTAEVEAVPAVKLEYVELVHPTTLVPLDEVEVSGLLAIAAHLGTTRLIDNIVLNRRKPIIAIDGPAGAGKSTVARQVSRILDLLYLDTGAMYRAVTWLVLQSGVSLVDEAAIAELTSQCRIRLEPNPQPSSDSVKHQPQSPQSPTPIQVWVNNQDVTQAIRTPEVTANVSAIAAQVAVREALVKQQQAQGSKGGIVLDGRDIGTHVFPDAELKIFLTATPAERARRRLKDLEQQGYQDVDIQELEASIRHRDHQDSTRLIAPLRKAIDAIEIQTDALTIEDVTAHIVELYRQIPTG